MILSTPFAPHDDVNPDGYTSETPAVPATWENPQALIEANFRHLGRRLPYVVETVGNLSNIPPAAYPVDGVLQALVYDTGDGDPPTLSLTEYALISAHKVDDGAGNEVDNPYNVAAETHPGAVEGQPAADGTRRWWVPLATREVETVEVPAGSPEPTPVERNPPRRQDRYPSYSATDVLVSRAQPTREVGLQVLRLPLAGELVRFTVRVPYQVSPWFPQSGRIGTTGPISVAPPAYGAGDGVPRLNGLTVGQSLRRLQEAERDLIDRQLPTYRPTLELVRRDELHGTEQVVATERVGAVDSGGTLSMTGTDRPGAGQFAYFVRIQYADAVGARDLLLEVS